MQQIIYHKISIEATHQKISWVENSILDTYMHFRLIIKTSQWVYDQTISNLATLIQRLNVNCVSLLTNSFNKTKVNLQQK